MFDDQAKSNIQTYKYHGGDNSPLYQHVLSPFAQWCVDQFVPSWMAPNVITALGLLCSFSAVALTLVFNPTLGTGSIYAIVPEPTGAVLLSASLGLMALRRRRA